MAADRQQLTALVEIMRRLLGPEGCPWDREQTHESLEPYVLEEAREVADAIEHGNPDELCEELGDLLMLIVFQAELARRAGTFTIERVIEGICDKMIRRHPHVFADAEAATAAEVVDHWNRVKREEKRARATAPAHRHEPALQRAQRVGDRLAGVGFDWPDASGPRAKVIEELGELDEAVRRADARETAEELGDVLMATANLARHLGHDAEDALTSALDRFEARFGLVEVALAASGRQPRECTLDELEAAWQAAKSDHSERSARESRGEIEGGTTPRPCE
jgi:MazG family protein